MIAPIEFTAKEKAQLAFAMRLAMMGIASAWEVLSEAGERMRLDWEPKTDGVCDIANHLAAALSGPMYASLTSEETILECFTAPADWSTGNDQEHPRADGADTAESQVRQ